MCMVKTPKVEQPKEKPVQVFTNSYFTNQGPSELTARLGRNALRINRQSA